MSQFNITLCEYESCGSKPARGKSSKCYNEDVFKLIDSSCVDHCCNRMALDNLNSSNFDQCLLRNQDLERSFDQKLALDLGLGLGIPFGGFLTTFSCIFFWKWLFACIDRIKL